ncbi:MAG: lamin tail domain-containing protein, partial [Flavobacteriales bacterium]|nr:lamin tail domain-containing protein [Flavobacteriales bacterium]
MKKTLLSIGLLCYCALAWTQIIPTEIMYNAPGTGGNDLEFIELYNAGSETIALEGYQLSDAGNFTFVFPAMDLAPSGIVLLATNKDVADVFYGVSFLDLPGAGNFLGNGGELIQLLDNNSQVVFAVTYDDASPWTTAPDGGGPSLELTDISADPTNGANWAASSVAAGTNGGFSIFASPGVFTPLTTSFVAFDEEFIVVNENAGSALIPISMSILNPTGASVTVSPGSFATAEEGTDFSFAETVVSFDDLTGSTVEIAIPVLDNMTESVDRLFTLTLSNPVNCELGEVTTFVVYILDDEETAPVATESLGLEFIGSYLVDAEGSAEIVAYNSARKRLYAMNSTGVKLEIIDFSDPANPFTVNTIDLSTYG